MITWYCKYFRQSWKVYKILKSMEYVSWHEMVQTHFIWSEIIFLNSKFIKTKQFFALPTFYSNEPNWHSNLPKGCLNRGRFSSSYISNSKIQTKSLYYSRRYHSWPEILTQSEIFIYFLANSILFLCVKRL